MTHNVVEDVYRLLNSRPIAYRKEYARYMGSVTGGVALSQIMYWFSKKNKIYKTDKDMANETGLGRGEMRRERRMRKLLIVVSQPFLKRDKRTLVV